MSMTFALQFDEGVTLSAMENVMDGGRSHTADPCKLPDCLKLFIVLSSFWNPGYIVLLTNINNKSYNILKQNDKGGKIMSKKQSKRLFALLVAITLFVTGITTSPTTGINTVSGSITYSYKGNNKTVELGERTIFVPSRESSN